MRRRIIDYSGTLSLDGTSSLSPKRISPYTKQQLIDYFGTRSSEGHAPHIPRGFFLVHETMTNYSTTSVLDLRMGQVPYLSRGSSSMKWRIISTTSELDLRMGHTPYLPKEFLRPWDDNWSTTSVLDPRMEYFPHLQQGLSHPRGDNSSTTTVLEQSLNFLQRNYSSKWQQANWLLQYSKK